MIMLKTCLGGSFVILCIRKRIFCVKLGKLIVQNFLNIFEKGVDFFEQREYNIEAVARTA